MQKVTLRNDFHNSEVNVWAEQLPHETSPYQTKRIRRELCGMADCVCGSIRGPQDVKVLQRNNAYRTYVLCGR